MPTDIPAPVLTATLDLGRLPLLEEWAQKTGLSISLISRVMAGQRFPSEDSAAKLAAAIEVSVPEFFQIRERVVKAGGMMRVHPVTVTAH